MSKTILESLRLPWLFFPWEFGDVFPELASGPSLYFKLVIRKR
ncbi:MAG: hypothetical protein ABH867_05225 [Patescibacteria group bacterium]